MVKDILKPKTQDEIETIINVLTSDCITLAEYVRINNIRSKRNLKALSYVCNKLNASPEDLLILDVNVMSQISYFPFINCLSKIENIHIKTNLIDHILIYEEMADIFDHFGFNGRMIKKDVLKHLIKLKFWL